MSSNSSCALEFGVILEDFCAIELPITGMFSVCFAHCLADGWIILVKNECVQAQHDRSPLIEYNTICHFAFFHSEQAQKYCFRRKFRTNLCVRERKSVDTSSF